MAYLTTLSTLKDYLGIAQSNVSRDAQLQALLIGADSAIRRYCNRNFEQATYTEYLSGANTQKIWLKETPVTSITSLWLDSTGFFGSAAGSYGTTSLLTSGIDYALAVDDNLASMSKSGIVYRIGTVWPIISRINIVGKLTAEMGPSSGNIKVTYVGGYAVMPPDLGFAVCNIVSYLRRTLPLGGNLHSEHIGDYSYSLMTLHKNSLLDIGSAMQILSKYREVGW